MLPPSQPPFPLVIATLDRAEELGRFFAAILDQGPFLENGNHSSALPQAHDLICSGRTYCEAK